MLCFSVTASELGISFPPSVGKQRLNMIGSFLTRALILVMGYAYPAYECFKIVELNKPEIEQLRFWCQYWILVAALTVFDWVGDTFISWLPMYCEAKLAFFVYLWYPKTKGTAYVYDTFFRPYIAKHENEIDRNLIELRTRAGDILVIYLQSVASYGQTRLFDILQYFASQSPTQLSRSQPAQQRQLAHQTPSAMGTVYPPATFQPQQVTRRPRSPTKSQLQEPAKEVMPQPSAPLAAQPRTSSDTNGPLGTEPISIAGPSKMDSMQVEVSSAPAKDLNPPLPETPMEEAIRMTRGRLRKRAAAGAGPPPL